MERLRTALFKEVLQMNTLIGIHFSSTFIVRLSDQVLQTRRLRVELVHFRIRKTSESETRRPLFFPFYTSVLECDVICLKGNSGIFIHRPYFWHEIRSSTHREQFGESLRPSEDI